MSTKASIARPVTRVALDDTVAVRPRRESLARAGRRDPGQLPRPPSTVPALSSPSPTRSATSSTRAV
jgi:hypothetical protein